MPGISAGEEFTDNVRSVAKGRQSDVITTVTPSINVIADTPRLTGTFSYTPMALEHITATDQNQIIQTMSGASTLVLVPELFFFDTRVSMSNVDRAGGFGFNNQAQVPTSLSTQTTTYSASPYLRFHFGDIGDEEVRYQVSQALFSGNTGAIAGPVTGTNLGAISDSTQQELLAKFTTGEGLGRTKLTASNDYVDFSSASSQSSKQETADLNGEYNVFGPYFVLSEVGYQRLNYTQQSPLNFSGPIWSVGARFQPRVDRLIQLTYGESQGQTGFSGQVQYAVTPLTTVTASYSHQSTTQQQQLLQALGNTPLGGLGGANPGPGGALPVQPGFNPLTGLPNSLQNPNLALQNSAMQVKTLQANVRMQGGERNVYTLTFNRTEEAAVGAGALSQTTTGGFATWSRDMSPNTTGNLSAGYADTLSNAGGAGGTAHAGILTFTAGIVYAVSETLTAATSYSLSREKGGPQGTVLVDVAMVTLTKHF